MFIVVVSDVFPPPSAPAPAPMVARLYTGTLRDVHGKEEEGEEEVASGSARFSLPSSARRRKQAFLLLVVMGRGPWKCLRSNEGDAEKKEEEEEDRLATTFAMALVTL